MKGEQSNIVHQLMSSYKESLKKKEIKTESSKARNEKKKSFDFCKNQEERKYLFPFCS